MLRERVRTKIETYGIRYTLIHFNKFDLKKRSLLYSV